MSNKYNITPFNRNTVSNEIIAPSEIVRNKFNLASFNAIKNNHYTVASTISTKGVLRARAKPSLSQICSAPTRYIAPIIEIYFNGDEEPPLVLQGANQIDTMYLLEELKADSKVILGTASSNELNISLINEKRLLSPTNPESPYFGKMKPNTKIKASIKIEDAYGTSYTMKLGTFFTMDWEDDTLSMTISTPCHDILYLLNDRPFSGTRAMKGKSFFYWFERLFKGMGLSTVEYNIDESLQDITVKVGYLPTGTFREALNMLVEASSTFVYVDRDGIIQVKSIDLTAPAEMELTDEDQIKFLKIPMSYEGSYAKLEIDVYEPTVKDVDEEILRLTDVPIFWDDEEHGLVKIENSLFSNGPIMGISKIQVVTSTGNDSVKVHAYGHSATHLNLNLFTEDSTPQTVSVIVHGYPIVFTNSRVTATNSQSEAMKNIIGDKTYTIQNKLIQDKDYALGIGNSIFPLMINPTSNIELSVRGNPVIEPGSILMVNDVTDNVLNQKVLVYRHKLDFVGGLSGTLVGFNLTSEEL